MSEDNCYGGAPIHPVANPRPWWFFHSLDLFRSDIPIGGYWVNTNHYTTEMYDNNDEPGRSWSTIYYDSNYAYHLRSNFSGVSIDFYTCSFRSYGISIRGTQ